MIYDKIEFVIFQIFITFILAFIIGSFGGIKQINSQKVEIRPIWTAYFYPTFWLNIYILIFDFFVNSNIIENDFFYQLHLNKYIILLTVYIVIVLKYLLNIYQAWSNFIIIDSEGVWNRKGILPWTKSWAGLNWKDVERAWSIQGFVSWVLRSYKIEVNHRFLSDVRFVVSHMPRGSASKINEFFKKYSINIK